MPQQDPSAYLNMSVDELTELLTSLYDPRRRIAYRDRLPDNAVTIAQALLGKVNKELEAIEEEKKGAPLSGRGLVEQREKREKDLKGILSGTKEIPYAPDFHYPWRNIGLEQGLKKTQARVSDIAKKATRQGKINVFIDRLVAHDENIRETIELATQKRPAPGPSGVSARADLKAIEQIVDGLIAGRDPSPIGVPPWIANYMKTPQADSAFEEVRSGVQYDEATGEYIPSSEVESWTPTGEPPAPTAAPTAAAPTQPMTADAVAAADAAVTEEAAEVPQTTGDTPAVRPADSADPPAQPPEAADAPTEVGQVPDTAPAPPAQPTQFGPEQFAAAAGEGRSLGYVAPTRTTIEDYWQQAAIEWWQDTFTGRGKIGSDPSRVTKDMVDTFKAMVTDVATQQGYQNELIGVNGMAFLETYFIQAPTEPRPEDQELPPGWEDAMARVARKRDGRENENYLNFNEDIRNNLDEYSPDDMTRRYSTEDKPTKDSIYSKLKRESGVARGQGGTFRDGWFKTEADLLYSLHETAIRAGTDADVEKLWDLVEGSIEDEEEPGGRLTQESYDSHVRIAKGPVTSSQVVSMLRESLLAKEPQLAELLSSDEGLLWLERQADVIKTKASKVATEHQTWDPTLGVHIPAHAQADAEVANLIAIETNKSVEDLQTEMALTEKKMLGEWVDGSDRSIAHKSLLRTDTALGDLKNAYWGSTIADEKNLTFEQWLRDDSGEAKTASDKFVRNQQEVIMGFNEKDALKNWFFEKLVDEGKWKYEGATKEEQARMNEHFQEFERQVGNAMMQEGAFISDVVTSVGETYIPTILTETDFKVQEAEKKRIVEAPFKARMAPEEALADATARLDERVGGPTLDQDIRDDTASLQDKIDEIADFGGDSSPYFVNGVGITQDEFDSKYTNATPEELLNFGVQTRDERAAGLDGEQEKLSDNLLQKQGQQVERVNDRAMAELLRDHPELAKVFASGSQKALEGAAASLGKDTVPDSLADHLVKSQERQGLVLTEDQKKFRMAWGLPLPSDTFRTPEQIAEQERESEIARARQASRTKRYTAEGDEIKFDPTRATYDVGEMSRSGPLTDVGGGSFIPGTTLPDTMENRAALAGGSPTQGQAQQVAPGVEVEAPPPGMLGYYPEEDEEDEDEITPRSPHDTTPTRTPTTPNQPHAPTRQTGGATGF